MNLSREERLDLIRTMADKRMTKTELAEGMKISVSAVSRCLRGILDLLDENMKRMVEMIETAQHKKVCDVCVGDLSVSVIKGG